jgi:L-rhamnonate dehydratase
MRITGVTTISRPMATSWLTDTVIATPLSGYTRHRERRSSWFGRMVASLVCIETEDGLTGLGYIGGGKAAAASIVEDQYAGLLVGADPFDTALLWDVLFRAAQMHGRRGAAMAALSGVDIALWDLVGQATKQPVYRLLGGATKPEGIPAYPTGNDVERYAAQGFKAVKLAMPYGPADGVDGMRANESLVQHAREIMGPDAALRLDCYMAWDVAYTVRMARMLVDYGIDWIEEPVLPDDVDGYRRIRDALTGLGIMVTGGEHCYTRHEFRTLLDRQAVDLVQPDIYRAGGISELRHIASLASAYHTPLIPHGIGAPTYHLVMATPNSPAAEFVDVFAQGGDLLLVGEPQPHDGMIHLSAEMPGFGYRLNVELLASERGPVPIW